MAEVVLAVETSGSVGSIGVSVDGDVLGREFLGERGSHARTAIPAIGRALEGCGRGPADLTAIVVGSGPGSFTGVRVAAAIAKGLATALGVPLHAISSLRAAALTEATFPEPREVESGVLRHILFDARGGRVFAAAYRSDAGRLSEVRAPEFTTVAAVLEDEELAGAILCGDGAVRNSDALTSAGRTVLPPPFGFPSADGLLRAFREESPAAVDLAVWEPDYLRASNAERERAG